ncbi:hypothetical protein JCM3774_004087 [Rhodotorula dairenensis]
MASAAVAVLRSSASRLGAAVLHAPQHALDAVIRSPSSTTTDATATAAAAAAAEGATAASLPSPVTYLTSAYLVTSLALAFFLHRIHHLVPPRHRSPTHNHHTLHSNRANRAVVQVACRLPAIAALVKVTASLAGALNLGPAAAAAVPKHATLLWQCYLAIAAAVTGETFVRALTDDLPHAHHQFNLLSFSFLLHVHSGPSSSSAATPATHSELYTYLLVTLLEILALQLSYCAPHLPLVNKLDAAYRNRISSLGTHRRSPAVRVYRLPITALFSLVGQYFAFRSWTRLLAAVAPPTTAAVPREAEEFGTVWLNKVPEVVLEVIVGSSIALKLLAALIRGEELSMENLVGPASLTPQPEEDYAVALIKYATHLLSTTRLSGLAHELSPLEVLPPSVASSLESLGFVEPPPCDSEDCPVHGAENRTAAREAREIARHGRGAQEVVLHRNGDVAFWDLVALDGHGRDLPGQHDGHHRVRSPTPGFTNEIRRVSVESPYGAAVDADGYAPDGAWTNNSANAATSPFSRRMAHIEGERKSALWRLIALCARIAMYVAYRVWRLLRRSVRRTWARLGLGGGNGRDEWELEQTWAPAPAPADATDSTSLAYHHQQQQSADGSATRRPGRRGARTRSPGPPDAAAWTLGGAAEPAGGCGGAAAQDEEDEDDDGGEWVPVPGAIDSDGADEEADEEGDSAWDDEAQEAEEEEAALVLYSDLMSRPQQRSSLSPNNDHRGGEEDEEEEDLAPYLLAHHLAPARQGPLTRRRYRAFLKQPGGNANDGNHGRDRRVAALASAIDHRRSDVIAQARRRHRHDRAGDVDLDVAEWMESEREKWREGTSRFCVVCTVEERTVVLWPCRCLCLCEPCRAALADRTTSALFDDGGGGGAAAAAGGGAGGQLCPTCRTPVQGFSRIFTP